MKTTESAKKLSSTNAETVNNSNRDTKDEKEGNIGKQYQSLGGSSKASSSKITSACLRTKGSVRANPRRRRSYSLRLK